MCLLYFHTYIQNPFSFLVQTGDCQYDGECPDQLACIKHLCQNPCEVPFIPCGQEALCTVSTHRPVCQCPPEWAGDPHDECYTCRSIFVSSFVLTHHLIFTSFVLDECSIDNLSLIHI